MSDTETKIPEFFTWGTGSEATSTAIADIPQYNLAMLAWQGYRHKVGNEIAAKLAAWVKTDDGKAADDATKSAKVTEWRNEMLDKIVNGVLGVRAASGPRVSGIEAIKRQVAVEFLKAALAAYNTRKGTSVSVPTGEKTIRYMGEDMNRDQLIDAYMRANEAKVTAEAERRQAEQAAGADVGEDLFGE